MGTWFKCVWEQLIWKLKTNLFSKKKKKDGLFAKKKSKKQIIIIIIIMSNALS